MNIRKLDRVLFFQKPEVIEEQALKVKSTLISVFPDLEIFVAGSADDVPETEIDAMIAPTLPSLPQALARIQGLQWIHFLSAGVEKIWDMPVDWRRLTLTKSSGVHGPQMSEYVIGAMLHFAKGFDRFTSKSKVREWSRFWLSELSGLTVLVLGGGHVGRWVARRCKAFDMRVIAVQRCPRPTEWVDVSISLEAAREYLPEADYLVVCVPLTEDTRGMVDAAFLSSLPPGATLVDVSRGGVVCGEAVLAALDMGHLRGAALDVFEDQPLPTNSPLWGRSDVLVTPHVAGTSPHYLERALDIFVTNARAWRAGTPLLTSVDQALRY